MLKLNQALLRILFKVKYNIYIIKEKKSENIIEQCSNQKIQANQE